jgi:hypothetical protein
MSDGRRPAPRDYGEHAVRAGPGALCVEAQADGVPCSEVGRDCEVCPKAEQNLHVAHAADLTAATDPASDPSSADW